MGDTTTVSRLDEEEYDSEEPCEVIAERPALALTSRDMFIDETM